MRGIKVIEEIKPLDSTMESHKVDLKEFSRKLKGGDTIYLYF